MSNGVVWVGGETRYSGGTQFYWSDLEDRILGLLSDDEAQAFRQFMAQYWADLNASSKLVRTATVLNDTGRINLPAEWLHEALELYPNMLDGS